MRHGSLFSGIGGFDLAAEWMGWENVFHCEWNEFGQKILKYYWPKAITYNDITKTDFTIHRGNIDILTGGFPCQPYSTAGKRKGTEDSRHLWPEMLRAIGEIQPTWIVGENVRGLTNWNGGLVFDEVQSDLEAKGYEVLPFLLPACAVNAPHRRDRIWFVAYSNNSGANNRMRTNEEWQAKHERWEEQPQSKYWENCGNGDVANTESESSGWELFEQSGEREFGGCNSTDDATNANSRRQPSEEHRKKESGQPTKKSVFNYWENFPTQPPICGGNDGLPAKLDGITFPKWRNESIKAYGNAIVPQVAFEIFKSIESYDNINF